MYGLFQEFTNFNRRRSKQFHCNESAGLGIGEGVVVVGEVVAAGGRDGLELVVGKQPAIEPS